MKIRKGFVSNSSSSSFIIKKDGLTQTQINILRSFVRGNLFVENDIESEDEKYIIGTVEAHNRSGRSDDEDFEFRSDAEAFTSIIELINAEDNVRIRYEAEVCPKCFDEPKTCECGDYY